MLEEESPRLNGQELEESKSQPLPRLALLKTMQVEAEGLIAARAKAVLIHNTKNINAAGDLVEKSVREVLRKRLPNNYHVGQGHVIDPSLKTSPQFDIIIADNNGFPALFRDDNGTEWLPCEGVYAIGEIKSSYDKSKRPVETFSRNLQRTKAEFNWPKMSFMASAYTKNGEIQNAITRDQLFSFMVFVDSNNLKPEDLEEFYKITPVEHLPNILYFVDRGVMLSMKFGGKEGTYPKEMNLYPEVADRMGLVEDKSKWCLRLFKDDNEEVGLGMAFFTFYYLIMSHLGACRAHPPALFPYYLFSILEMRPRMHYHIFD